MIANVNGWDGEENRERTQEGETALFPQFGSFLMEAARTQVARRDLMSFSHFFLLEPL